MSNFISGLTLGGQISFFFFTVVLMAGGYDILPITFDRIPLDIRDDTYFLRGLAYDYIEDGKVIHAVGLSSLHLATFISTSNEVGTWRCRFQQCLSVCVSVNSLQASVF